MGREQRVYQEGEAGRCSVRDEIKPTNQDAIRTSVANAVAAELARPLASALYLVATPIGHLADMTVRAVAVLARADTVYCEDTRHSRVLLDHYGISTHLDRYDEHNAAAARPRILARLADGQAVALISDAGTPLVSDPGYKLVHEAIAAGYRVVAVPGPSALLTALTASGLPTDAFFFAGFLPPKSAARRTRLEALARIPGTLVLYEAPGRLADCLADIAAVLGQRVTVVARELTKLNEETRRGAAAELAAAFEAAPPRGEIALVIAPPVTVEVSDDDIRRRLAVALATETTRDAARLVAEATGLPRGRVYDLALAMKREGSYG